MMNFTFTGSSIPCPDVGFEGLDVGVDLALVVAGAAGVDDAVLDHAVRRAALSHRSSGSTGCTS